MANLTPDVIKQLFHEVDSLQGGSWPLVRPCNFFNSVIQFRLRAQAKEREREREIDKERRPHNHTPASFSSFRKSPGSAPNVDYGIVFPPLQKTEHARSCTDGGAVCVCVCLCVCVCVTVCV